MVGKSTAFTCLVLLALGKQSAIAQEGGYADPLSVEKGGTVEFHLSSARTKGVLSVYHSGGSANAVWTSEDLNLGLRTIPESAYTYGCNWPVSCSFQVPESFPS